MGMTEQQLRERLRKIAALFEGAKTPGERDAAAAAMDRVKQSLGTLPPEPEPPREHGSFHRQEPVVEMQFSLSDLWQRRLMSALCRRHKLVPFRYRRQRHTTLMVRGQRSYIENILWPEYCQLRDALDEFLGAATDRIIREEVFNDAREAQEQPD